MCEIAPNSWFEKYSSYKSDCAAIRRYVDQAFYDFTEKSNNKKHFECFIMNKPLRRVPTQGIVEQAKQNGKFSPQRGNQERLKTPIESELTKDDALIKDN